jgi:hypothetical protein
MLPMRRQKRQRLSVTARHFRGACTALVVLGALALGGRTAAAQATAPAPQTPPLEAGDTAPPPGAPPPPIAEPAPPITPLPSAATPEAPALTAPLVLPEPPAPRREPIYRQHWFWGAVGVLVLTGAVVLLVSLSNQDPATPNTRLGDMRAF